MKIREAGPKDARTLGEIHVEAWRAAYRGQLSDAFLDELSADERAEQWRTTLEAPPGSWRTWVAEEDGELLGWVTTGSSGDADADERTAELYAIYLRPEQVGTGVGRGLFEHAVEDLRARGFASVTLWVLETNERARRFYEVAGWKHDGTVTSERVDCEMRPTVRYRVEL